MTPYVIGIDIGTGSTKALAIDASGKTVASAQVHYETSTPEPGMCEQDPRIVWTAFTKAIRTVTDSIHDSPHAIVLSSAMHSLIPVDSNGNAISPMMIWADNRSAAIASRVHDSALGELLYEQNGTPIHAMTPLCKIIWLREHKPLIFDSAYKFISIKEYIWFKLFKVFEVDHSIGSATGMMNIELCEWNESALHLCQIESERLSRIVQVNHSENCTDSEVCAQLGIQTRTRFLIGSSDGCFANLGSFATEPGVAALTIGTSGAIRLASKVPLFNFKAMTFNYRLENIFICGGPVNNGGVALKWFVTNFLKQPLETKSDYTKVLDLIDKAAPGSDGILFLPYLYGDRAPIWNSDATASFFGMRSHHNQSHFTRAVIEGISFALYDVAEQMAQAGSNIERIHVSGGFVNSSAWLQILADIFGKKICLLNMDDASAFGAALIGLRETGIVTSISALMPAHSKEYVPRPSVHLEYKKTFQRYRKLYEATKDLMTY